MLLDDFSLKIPLDSPNQIWKDKILSSKNSVFLHIRRGDYLSAENAIFVRLDKGYYNGALRLIREKIGRIHLFVFSNDMVYCKENLSEFLDSNLCDEIDFVEGNGEDNATFELELMKSCQNAIIANSTFSYWAAYLMNNPRKIIVAPSEFFYTIPSKPFENIVSKLCPKDWQIVDYRDSKSR